MTLIFVIFSPPPGCLQFHTGIDGRFTTFNWNNPTTAQITHLRSQNYRICMRQEEGKDGLARSPDLVLSTKNRIFDLDRPKDKKSKVEETDEI